MILRNMLILTVSLLALIFILLLTEDNKNLGQVVNDAPFCHNGICDWAYRVSMKGNTSTPCSIKSPEATSTIVHASADLATATTSAMVLEIGTANNNNATTTSLASSTLAANSKGRMVATSTLWGFYPFSRSDLTNHIIAPNNYVNLRVNKDSISNAPLGNCEVIFRVL